MNYTGLVSMVKSASQVCHHFGLFLDFLKTASDVNWDLKGHKN